MMNKATVLLMIIFLWNGAHAQAVKKILPTKVSHAEPIYFDLIRDLGARKGERELNVGMGIEDHRTRSEYLYFIEYEFAPVNRLGLELELPMAFAHGEAADIGTRTEKGLQAIKTAIQYSFFVSDHINTTMAVGYIFERPVATQNIRQIHNPFFVIAKRWGKQFHSMLYTGPIIECDRKRNVRGRAMTNASIHYMLPGSRNLVGVEVNEEGNFSHAEVTVRPQIKMTLSSSSAIGLSLGMASNRQEQPFDFLIRWIYELRKKS